MKKIFMSYSREELWKLFLLCAFPFHVWTLLLSFNDVSWLSTRTNVWDAIGVICYGLIFALFESILVFAVAALLGYFISPSWGQGKRVVLIGSLIFMLSVWSMLSQISSLFGWPALPNNWIEYLAASGHPARIFYPILLILVSISMAFPAYVILFSEKLFVLFDDLADRICLLTSLYLGLDAIAFLVLLFRNA